MSLLKAPFILALGLVLSILEILILPLQVIHEVFNLEKVIDLFFRMLNTMTVLFILLMLMIAVIYIGDKYGIIPLPM